MLKKLDNKKERMEYIASLHPYTLIDVFERPDDDDDIIHTYVAVGVYKATMADERLFSGTSREAISVLNKNSKFGAD